MMNLENLINGNKGKVQGNLFRGIDNKTIRRFSICLLTGKSVSEALILESVNPQYDDRLFIELRV